MDEDKDIERQIERQKALMHKRLAMVLEVLRSSDGGKLCAAEQAAIVCTLSIEPGIREQMVSVIKTAMGHDLERRAQTCQCSECRAKRSQA